MTKLSVAQSVLSVEEHDELESLFVDATEKMEGMQTFLEQKFFYGKAILFQKECEPNASLYEGEVMSTEVSLNNQNGSSLMYVYIHCLGKDGTRTKVSVENVFERTKND